VFIGHHNRQPMPLSPLWGYYSRFKTWVTIFLSKPRWNLVVLAGLFFDDFTKAASSSVFSNEWKPWATPTQSAYLAYIRAVVKNLPYTEQQLTSTASSGRLCWINLGVSTEVRTLVLQSGLGRTDPSWMSLRPEVRLDVWVPHWSLQLRRRPSITDYFWHPKSIGFCLAPEMRFGSRIFWAF